MKVLGIESSCDETAAAVVEDGRRLLSTAVASSMDLHARYGGVIPEIAARSHIEVIIPVIEQALVDARCSWDDIDAIAVTRGAGLGGSLLIGVLTARTLALIKGKPLLGVNHVEGHLYANFLVEVGSINNSQFTMTNDGQSRSALGDYTLPEEQPAFPLLGIIVSGGHSQLVFFRDHFDYTLLGQTHDDAIGEAFDKVGKILGLPYPGGPNVSKTALSGDPMAFEFPKAKLEGTYDFSFSGVKTAVLRLAQRLVGEDHTFPSTQLAARLNDQQKADIAASFQRIAIETIVDKVVQAYDEYAPAGVIVGGGVACNDELRRQLRDRLPCPVSYTDPKLCTDNAAMIATLGYFTARHHQPEADPLSLATQPNLSM